MRIITIDNGNSNPHFGIFQNEKLVSVSPLKDFIPQTQDFILISNVGKPLSIKPSFDLTAQNQNNCFFEMPIHYSKTLGDDRKISSYYIYKNLSPSENVLLIDAGTFMTIDLINNSGFAGGYIFPGIETFLSSFTKGSHLPHLQFQEGIEVNNLPHSTEEAILGATEIYLNSVLEKTIKQISPSKIVITGGNLELIKNKILKFNLSKVQLEMYPHLIHSALFWIYQNHLRSE